MSSLSVHIYINGSAVNACELTQTQCSELKNQVLQVLKPMNNHYYLDLDLDTNEEYGIITCCNSNTKIPSDVISRINKYISIPWSNGSLKILLSVI